MRRLKIVYGIALSTFTRLLIKTRWRKVIFFFIYKFNIWGSKESRSGDGSTLDYTKPLRSQLPQVLSELQVGSILDAPCGDFNWFSEMLKNSSLDLQYRGVDIVKELIEKNKKLFSSPGKIEFEYADLLNYSYSAFDCVLARDFLFHLSYKDTLKFLSNFCESQSKFLVTTSYPSVNLNTDIYTGKFRQINLFQEPYLMSSKLHFQITDYVDPFPPRYLYVFSRSEVVAALSEWRHSDEIQH